MAKKLKLSEDALEFFRKAGAKGGKARAKNVSPARRRRIAKKAALARWAPEG